MNRKGFPESYDTRRLLTFLREVKSGVPEVRAPVYSHVVYDIVSALGGSISAEHGLGVLKREEIRRYKSELELDLMRAIKRTLDPHGLMNPGKVL